MKRSEALDNICCVLNAKLAPQISKDNFIELAKVILYDIEERTGMLPPQYVSKTAAFMTNPWVTGWEDENEIRSEK
jgi:hypothetical protein